MPLSALAHDAAGRPVSAMRFMQGRTLADAVKAHHERPTALGLRELLQRFTVVCQTMACSCSATRQPSGTVTRGKQWTPSASAWLAAASWG